MENDDYIKRANCLRGLQLMDIKINAIALTVQNVNPRVSHIVARDPESNWPQSMFERDAASIPKEPFAHLVWEFYFGQRKSVRFPESASHENERYGRHSRIQGGRERCHFRREHDKETWVHDKKLGGGFNFYIFLK